MILGEPNNQLQRALGFSKKGDPMYHFVVKQIARGSSKRLHGKGQMDASMNVALQMTTLKWFKALIGTTE